MRIVLCCMLVLLLALPAGAAPATPTNLDTTFFLPEGEVIQTDWSYQSHDIAVTITLQRVEDTDVYIADVRLRKVASLQRAFAGGKWKKTTARVQDMAAENQAILAMTGDSGQNFTSGLVVGNGHAWRATANKKRDLCVIYRSGEMKTFVAPVDYAALRVEDVWQSFLFGPVLLDAQGHAMTTFNSNVKPANPRSVIGYYEPGHYCFVQVDGRRTPSAVEANRTNAGLSLERLAQLMEELGCTAAYNLDGGQSSMLWFGGRVMSTPYRGGRRVGDIVLIREVD